MSKGFIHGTQTGFHFLRMFIQSLSRILKLSLWILLFSFLFHLLIKADSYPFKPSLATKYFISQIDMVFVIDRDITFDEFNSG